MMSCFFPHRLVYEQAPTESPQEFWGKEVGKDVRATTTEEAVAEVQEHYGPAAYRQVLEDYLQKILPDPDPRGIRDQLTADSNRRYEHEFTREGGVLASFQKAIGALEAQRDRAIEHIEDNTRAELKILKERMEAEREARGNEPGIPEVPKYGSIKLVIPIKEAIEYRDAQSQAEKAFDNYLEAVLEAYMTSDLYDSDLGERLREGILTQAAGKIEALFRDGKASKETLTQLKQELDEQLQGYGSVDGKPGDLSVADASELLGQVARVNADLTELINTDYENFIDGLDKLRVMDPDSWYQSLSATASELIDDVMRNGNEEAFVDKVNEYRDQKAERTKEKYKEPIDDLNGAKIYFISEIVMVKGKAGARDAMDMLADFHRTLNERRANILDSVNHPVLKTMVFREREKLLRSETAPTNDWDRAVVEFMQHDSRGDREDVLKDPDSRDRLFVSIQLILRDYPDWFRDNSRNLPKRLTTASEAGKPTGHDRLARAKALIVLAEEAQWVVENYATTETLKSENLLEKLEAAKQDRRTREARILPDTNFRDSETLYDTRYQSIAARSGFTGKEMGLTLLKTIAGATVIANVMNSFRESGFKHFDKSVESALKNPFIYASVGVIYGVNRYRENPAVTEIPFASEGRRAEIVTHVGLNSLARKNGKDWVRSFIATPSEWGVMQHIKPREARKLVEKARDRAQKNGDKHPVIFKQDLEGAVPEDVRSHLPNEGNDAKRFAFYNKFLTSESTEVTQLQEQCNHWL